MADENSEQHELGDLHGTDNTDNLNKVQDNDNVNGIDSVQGTGHVHDAEQVHEADHAYDKEDVHNMNTILDSDTIHGVSIKEEETEDMHNTDNIHVSDTIHGVNIKHEETEDVHNTDDVHDSDSVDDVNIKHEETYPSEELQITQNVSGSVEEKRWPGWPGENVFRMLVPAKKVGGIIGRRGEYIKKTCEETKARIKVLDGPHGTTERAVLAHIRKHFNECGLHTRRTKIQTAVINTEHYKC